MSTSVDDVRVPGGTSWRLTSREREVDKYFAGPGKRAGAVLRGGQPDVLPDRRGQTAAAAWEDRISEVPCRSCLMWS